MLASSGDANGRRRGEPERPQQVRLERVCAGLHRPRSAESGELRHLETRIAAGVDAGEGFEVERDVHGEPVVARAAAHTHPDARELAPRDVYPGRITPALRGDAELRRKLDHGALERHHEATDAESCAGEIDERVDDE